MKEEDRLQILKLIKEIRQWTEEEMWCHHLDGSDLSLTGMIRNHPEHFKILEDRIKNRTTNEKDLIYKLISISSDGHSIITAEEHSALFDLMNNILRFKFIEMEKLINKRFEQFSRLE